MFVSIQKKIVLVQLAVSRKGELMQLLKFAAGYTQCYIATFTVIRKCMLNMLACKTAGVYSHISQVTQTIKLHIVTHKPIATNTLASLHDIPRDPAHASSIRPAMIALDLSV